MRKRGKKLLAVLLAASMTLGQGTTWTLAQEDVAEAIEGAAVSAQAEEDESESFGDESQDEPSGETGENPGEGEEGGSEGDGSSGDTSGSGDGSSEEGDQEDGDGGDNSEETGEENNSNGNGNPNGDLSGEPENPDGITDGEEDGTTETAETDFHYEDEKIIIDAKATEAAGFTKDTVLKADYLDPEGTKEQKEAYQNAVETIRQQLRETLTNNNEKATLDYVLYDVYFESPTGDRLEPEDGTVEVTMSFKEPVDLETKDPETNEQNYELLNQEVVHIQQDENDTKTAKIVENSDIQIENDKITSATFTQDSFSVMGLAWAKVAVQSASNGITLSAVELSTSDKNDPLSVWGSGIITGSGELDENTWNKENGEYRGYDDSSSNDIIRSFDSITYKLEATITNMDDKVHTLVYAITLPKDPEITLDTDAMSDANVEKEPDDDEATTVTYLCQYELKKDYGAGEGQKSIVVKIGNKHQGDEIEPTIKAYLDQDKDSAKTVKNMQKVTVTTAPMYNIILEKKKNEVIDRDIYDFNEAKNTLADEANSSLKENAEDYSGKDYKVNGYKCTFGVALEITKPGYGIKGVELPDATEDFKFDIDLSNVTLNGQNISSDFTPLLYYVGENKPGGQAITEIPFTEQYKNFEEMGCYDNGKVTMKQEGTILHVAVKDFKIDESKFPKKNYSKKSYWSDLNKINEGIFSSFQFQVVYPYINKNNVKLNEETENVQIVAKAEVKNMEAVSEVEETKVTEETSTKDNSQTNQWYLTAAGNREQAIYYSNRDGNMITAYSQNAEKEDQDIAAVGAQDLAFTVFYSQNNVGAAYPIQNMPVAIDQFVLFDSNAIGNVQLYADRVYGGNNGNEYGYSRSVRYAVLKDKDTNGHLDNQGMKTAKLEDFDFYDTPQANCDAVLIQYRGANLGKAQLDLRTQFSAEVKNDSNLADKVYMITAFTRVWDADKFADEIKKGTGKADLSSVNREELSTWIKNNCNTVANATNFVQNKESSGVIDHRNEYQVPTYENKVYAPGENHTYQNNWADALYIVPYTTTVTKTVAQLDEDGNPRKRYNIAEGQRYVDYKITSFINYCQPVEPTGNTTTVYLEDTIPEGLSYITNSAYLNGTYTSKFPSRGEVQDGEKNDPYEICKVGKDGKETGEKITNADELTSISGPIILKWKIENVPLKNGELPTLYYSCKISMNVKDNENLDNTVSIQTNEDKRPILRENQNRSTTGVAVTKKNEFYIVKRGGENLELHDESYYDLVAANTSSEDKKNLCLIDTMPCAEDGKSDQMKGEYKITSLVLTIDSDENDNNDDIELWYTSDPAYIGKKADQIEASEVNDNHWKKATSPSEPIDKNENTIKFTGDGLIGDWPTAIAYKDKSLKSNTIVTLHLEYEVVAGAENDKFVNTWSTMSKNDVLMDSSVTTAIYKRTLEGTVWFDKNQNGIIDGDETKLEGVKVTLYIEDKDGNYVPYTPYDETVAEDGYKSKKEDKGITYTDENGHYKFTGLPAGKYKVKFESSNDTTHHTHLDHYRVTEADVNGTNTSKVTSDNVNLSQPGILKDGTIEDIIMPSLKEMVEKNQKTYNLPNQNLGLIIPEINVDVEKEWEDNQNQDGKRPESIKIELYGKADGEEKEKLIESKEVTGNINGDSWKCKFENLPKYSETNLKDLKEITYTVKEVLGNNTDYISKVTGSMENGFTITNTHTPETITVEGTKTWKDSNDSNKKRPEKITIRLFGNGSEVASKKVTAENGIWKWKFDKLPKYNAGKEIVYTVTEDSISNYTSAVNGYNITNTYNPGKTSLTVTKKWDDGDDQDNKRPKSIEVKLLANKSDTQKTLTLTAENNWTGNFSELNICDEDGKEISYTVEEVKVDKYTTEITGDATKGYIITNTYKPETVKIPVKKVWNDSNNADRIRPKDVVISLLANGKQIQTLTLSESNHWAGTFENLAKYSKGKEITYTVEELKVEGYNCVITGDMENGYTVTNTHTPTPNIPSNPDPKPSVTPTPTATPTPSTTPTPSGTPTPSATPTPSGTPKPSEAPKPSVTPPAEETPTPAPAAGSITVTKNLKVNGTPVGAENQKFYVALFEDEDCTQRASDVKTLAFQYASSATVTFDNLEPGKTYYVSETDENGEAILAGILDSGDIYTADFTNGNVVSVDSKNGSAVDFDNEFEDIPDGFYYAGNLKVTKTLLGADGKAKNSDKTFYAGVFADADHTKLSDQVAKNIIPLSLNGASSVSDEVEVYMENADSVVKLYVTEVDKSGTPVEKDSSFAYSVTVKDGNATISKDALDARVVITNQEKNNSTPQGGGDTPSTQGGGSNPQSYSSGSSSVTPVKTGDSTPVMAMLLLLAASALVISTVMAKKKKSK